LVGDRTRLRTKFGKRRVRLGRSAAAWLVAILLAATAHAGSAPDDVDDVLRGIGTVTRGAGEDDAAEPAAGTGVVAGQVFDAENGAPVDGVTVLLIWPPPADGSDARQEVKVSGVAGDFEFEASPSSRPATAPPPSPTSRSWPAR